MNFEGATMSDSQQYRPPVGNVGDAGLQVCLDAALRGTVLEVAGFNDMVAAINFGFPRAVVHTVRLRVEGAVEWRVPPRTGANSGECDAMLFETGDDGGGVGGPDGALWTPRCVALVVQAATITTLSQCDGILPFLRAVACAYPGWAVVLVVEGRMGKPGTYAQVHPPSFGFLHSYQQQSVWCALTRARVLLNPPSVVGVVQSRKLRSREPIPFTTSEVIRDLTKWVISRHRRLDSSGRSERSPAAIYPLMLGCIHRMGAGARAVARDYPSLARMLDAFCTGDTALQNVQVESTAGKGTQNLGPKRSKRLHAAFHETDPDALLP